MKEPSSLKPSRKQNLLFAVGTDIRANRWGNSGQLLGWHSLRVLSLLLSDALALGVAWQLARFLNKFYSPIPDQLVWWVWLGLPSLFWLFAAVTLLLFTHYGLYGATVRARDYLRAAQLVSCVYFVSLVLAYFYDPKLDAPRSLFFSAWVGSIFLVLITRLGTNGLLARWQGARSPSRVFLITNASRMHRLSKILEQRSHYRVVGAAIVSMANTETIFQQILSAQPDEVFAEDVPDVELASGLYWRLRSANIPLRLLPSSREMLYRRGMPEIVAGLPTLMIETSVFQSVDYRIKRWLDYGLATLTILLLSPVFVGVAISIRINSPGPVFFKQERIGLRGQVFQLWKFRSMTADAPQRQAQLEQHNQSVDGIMFKLQNDPRITPVGRFLRRTSLDELPQLFNVLLGQMSLVGPRPLPLRDVAQFDQWHHIRHQVLPGITGLWQVSGRSDIENFDDAARLDLHYIDNWSLNLDLEILMATLRIVLTGLGAY
ncbi:sugar transferase [Leptothoe spongobia]|uniref:Sugar transferase n=1 Tax=Leptothoe spongobia TAU-MAC 1115 TaxID=1967444 RepID=A0A947GHV8_9CYAN|nr:sugar transferase [Leptothoe spongobia]MBT9315234.1 sugar transferase [Leptothoe spongobia TAU-MAC 1115]